MATLRKRLRLCRLDKFQRAANAVQILAGNIHGPGFSEAHADKDRVEIFFQLLEAHVPPDFHVLAEFDAQRFHHFHFAQRIGDARFVRRDAVRVQSAGKFAPVKHRHAVTLPRQMRRARQGRRPRADAGHAPPIRLARVKQPNVAVQHMIHGESLQPANLDGLLALLDHDARAFAQHFGGANAPATFAENIRFQDHARRAAHIRRHDALDEAGHVDPRGTRLNAGSVKTIEAPRGFDGRLARVHRRRDVRKILFVFFRGQFRRGLAKGHALTSSSCSPLKYATRWTNFPTGRQGQNSSAILASPDKSNVRRICVMRQKAQVAQASACAVLRPP